MQMRDLEDAGDVSVIDDKQIAYLHRMGSIQLTCNGRQRKTPGGNGRAAVFHARASQQIASA